MAIMIVATASIAGAIMVSDILAGLEKPGRDPRPDFKVARFGDGVEDIRTLKPGMTLEATVSKVAGFCAFIDLSVHEGGLVHASQLADRFGKDAREVVRTVDVVEVEVLEVDLARKRIALTKKQGAEARHASAVDMGPGRGEMRGRAGRAATVERGQAAMAAAFAGLQRRR